MKNWIMLGILLFSGAVRADIVCHGQTAMGPVDVVIGQKRVSISGAALEGTHVYTDLNDSWDGHKTGMITARDLSISYENWYGCIHNVDVNANFREYPAFFQHIRISQCAGGSTPDKICQVR